MLQRASASFSCINDYLYNNDYSACGDAANRLDSAVHQSQGETTNISCCFECCGCPCLVSENCERDASLLEATVNAPGINVDFYCGGSPVFQLQNCANLFQHLNVIASSTPSAPPTTAPSPSPSAAPTAAPATSRPTGSPSSLPTSSPATSPPTAPPTANPTYLPITSQPTEVGATWSPTIGPSADVTPPPLAGSSERSSKSNTGDGLLIGIVVVAVAVLALATLAWRRRRQKAQASKLFGEHTANRAFSGGYAEPRPRNVGPRVAAPGQDTDDSDADGYLAVGAASEAQPASSSSKSKSKSTTEQYGVFLDTSTGGGHPDQHVQQSAPIVSGDVANAYEPVQTLNPNYEPTPPERITLNPNYEPTLPERMSNRVYAEINLNVAAIPGHPDRQQDENGYVAMHTPPTTDRLTDCSA